MASMKRLLLISYVVTTSGARLLPAGHGMQSARRTLDDLERRGIDAYVVVARYRHRPKKNDYELISTFTGSNIDFDKPPNLALEEAFHYHEPARHFDGQRLAFKKVKPWKAPKPEPVKQYARVGYIITRDGPYELPTGSDLTTGTRELKALARRGVPAVFVLAAYTWSARHGKYRLEGSIAASNYDRDPRGGELEKLMVKYQPANWYDGQNFQFRAVRVRRAREKSASKTSVSSVLDRLRKRKSKKRRGKP